MSNNAITIENQNAETLTDIQGLQEIEQELFSKLEAGIADGSLTYENQTSIIAQIDKISQMRINLYQTLNDMNSFYQGNVESSVNTLSEQVIAVGIVEDELKEAQKRLELIKNEKNNKQRLVEVNSYYSERYADYTNLMKTIVFICIILIILSLLSNYNILPQFIYSGLLILVMSISIIYLFIKIVYLTRHDNMDYDEYNWNFVVSKAPTVDTTAPNTKAPWISSTTTGTCVGQQCCYSGNVYDLSLNQCIPSSSTSNYGSTSSSYNNNEQDPFSNVVGSITSGISNTTQNVSRDIGQSTSDFFA